MPVSPSFHAAHEISGTSLADGRSILAIIGFGAGRPVALPPEIPFLEIPMPVLEPGPCYEVWSSQGHVDHQANAPISFATAGGMPFAPAGSMPFVTAGGMLFGIAPVADAPGGDIGQSAFDTYSHIFRLADETGYGNLIRVFNYLPGINADHDGTERYKLFNAGRHRAFAAHRRPVTAAPSACALGMQHGTPSVYFLASKTAGTAIENPRQVSAYRYPPQYGSTSPSFSRAMTLRHGPQTSLYISGTASIVGHESLHEGDPAAQTAETLRNIEALLHQCGEMALPRQGSDMSLPRQCGEMALPRQGSDMSLPRQCGEMSLPRQCSDMSLRALAPRLTLKIYVRRPEDAAAIRTVLDRSGPFAGVMILQADICRRELLVEIEGFCILPA